MSQSLLTVALPKCSDFSKAIRVSALIASLHSCPLSFFEGGSCVCRVCRLSEYLPFRHFENRTAIEAISTTVDIAITMPRSCHRLLIVPSALR